MPRSLALGLCLAVFAPVASLHAQPPAASAELLRLVPDDMALCLLIQDLRGYSAKFRDSTWHKSLEQSPWVKALLESEEFRQLAKFEGELSKRLGVTWPEVRDDLLGDAVALAYRGGAKPEDEQGLLLMKARNADFLAKFVERINREQKVKLTEKVHAGTKYLQRADRHGTQYYYLQGPLLAVTSREDLLKSVIDGQDRKGGIVLDHVRRAPNPRALATLWANPRAFDEELLQKAKEFEGVEGQGFAKFVALWKALDGLLLSFAPERELELGLTIVARPKDLPPAAQRFFTQASKPSDLWQRFPSEALLAVAGQVDAAALVESVAEFLPASVRKTIGDSLQGSVGALMGMNLMKEVLPNLGPDWGLCLLPPPKPREYPHVLAALAVRPGDKEVDQALMKALYFSFQALVAHLNVGVTEYFRLKTVKQDKVDVHYLYHAKHFPPGFQPAFALKDGYLVFASCPEAILRFQKSGKGVAGKDAPFVRMSLAGVARLLKEHEPQLVRFLADKNGITVQAASQLFAGLLAVLEPFDHFTLSQKSAQGQFSLIVRLGPRK